MEASDYLARIGAENRHRTPAELLHHLHERHLRAVPFENLDIHFGVRIVLDEAAILHKIVGRGRGGFCYELNFAFSWLLSRLGLDVTLLSGEVARPEGGFGIPFDHMALRVATGDEVWLADVGFGESFTKPLPLVPGARRDDSPYRYRLTRDGERWHLGRAEAGELFETQYRFTTAPRRLADFEPGCEYHQSSPESTFTRRVVTSRATEEGRVTLTRERLLLRRGSHRTETAIGDESAWREALAHHFGIVLENPR